MSCPRDPLAASFGLPPSLHIPIAAQDVRALEEFVGHVVVAIHSRAGRQNAIKIRPKCPDVWPDHIPLWADPEATRYRATLHPEFQLWVHVDYREYRMAWIRLGMPPLGKGIVLDHIANRKATRLRDYLHPYIRLVPVSHAVNTNAGHATGGEGMEREYMRHLRSLPEEARRHAIDGMRSRLVYADPMDLTKMLDVSTGTHTLNGVRDFQRRFYPS